MLCIGIDLGGTNIAAGIIDEQHKFVAKLSVKTEAEKGFEHIVKLMAGLVNDLCTSANIKLEDITGIGIGSPGSIDSKNGVVRYTNNIKLENAPLAQRLGSYINKPIFLSNDANCAALGEVVAGAASGCHDAIMITLGTGVGGGIIIDGKIFDGSDSFGAELGHTMLMMNGEKCTCGRNGCWEAYASATGLIRQTKAAIAQNPDSLMAKSVPSGDEVSGRTAFEASRQGDVAALTVVHNYISYIAEGLIDMVNIFRPEVILLGGGICNEGDYLLNPLREYVASRIYGAGILDVPPITRAALGNDAGIIGAAEIVKHHI